MNLYSHRSYLTDGTKWRKAPCLYYQGETPTVRNDNKIGPYPARDIRPTVRHDLKISYPVFQDAGP